MEEYESSGLGSNPSWCTKNKKMEWSDKIGCQVVYLGKLKMLDAGSVGVLKSVFDDCCTIVYPQNAAYEDDGKGGFKPIKNAPNQVYAHSAKLNEIKLVC